MLASALPVAATGAARVVVLQGNEAPRLEQALASLRQNLAVPVELLMLPPGADPRLDLPIGRTDRSTVLVALGPRASDHVAGVAPTGPTVHCLAGPSAMRSAAPALPSAPPVEQYVAWLARLVPKARTVALLHDPARNAAGLEAIAAALRSAGYAVVAQPVPDAAALPAALANIGARADVLLALPDASIYTSESARGILLFSFRKRIPVAGPSDAWVKLGALFALDWDYAEVGAFCAQLAARELQPARTPPPPLRPRVSVNLRTAAQLGLPLPAETLRSVDVRHE